MGRGERAERALMNGMRSAGWLAAATVKRRRSILHQAPVVKPYAELMNRC